MRPHLVPLLSLLILLAAWMVCASPPAQPLATQDLYPQTLSSTAWVTSRAGKGTGWLVDRGQRLLLTNLHVVGDQDGVEVVFPLWRDGRLIAQRDLYRDEWKKLAIAGRVV